MLFVLLSAGPALHDASARCLLQRIEGASLLSFVPSLILIASMQADNTWVRKQLLIYQGCLICLYLDNCCTVLGAGSSMLGSSGSRDGEEMQSSERCKWPPASLCRIRRQRSGIKAASLLWDHRSWCYCCHSQTCPRYGLATVCTAE